jgi:hypothetical protein
MNTDVSQLKDIHLPAPITSWPIAPGWICLLFITLGIVIYSLSVWQKRKQQKIALQYALKNLKELKNLLDENPTNINIPATISTLIRRTALHYFPRAEIAGLTGNSWLTFLNQSGKTTQFTGEIADLLINGPYQKQNTADLRSLLIVTETWLLTIATVDRKRLRKK